MAFVISFMITLICAELIFALETDVISPSFVYTFGLSDKADGEEGSEAANEFYLAKVLPFVGFVAKIGINISF